ncbi:MAG: GAF domain-containing protein [Anaerolineales bacterium]|jgi:GAF domain-containing protein
MTIPLVFLGLLAVCVSDGTSAATTLQLSLAAVMLVVAIALPLIGGLTPWPSQMPDLGLRDWVASPLARQQLALILAFVVGAYLVIVSFRLLWNRWLGKRRWLAGVMALLIGALAESVVFAVVGFTGTSQWPTILQAELLGEAVAVVALMPMLIWYLGYLGRSAVVEGGRSLFTVVRETLDLGSVLVEYRRRASRLDQLFGLLTEIQGQIVRSMDGQQLMDDICAQLLAHKKYGLVSIGLIQDGNQAIQVAALASDRSKVSESPAISMTEKAGEGPPAVTAVKTLQPALIQELSSKRRPKPWCAWVLQHGYKSSAALPMRVGNEVLGALIVCSREEKAFNVDEVRLLQAVADDLGHGLRRLRLEEQRTQRMLELEAMRELTTDMITQHDVPALLEALVQRATDLLKGSAGAMFLCEPGERLVRCVVSYRSSKDHTGGVLRYGEGAAGKVALSGEPLIVADCQQWKEPGSVFEDEPASALVSVPLVRQGQVAGVIDVMRGLEQPAFSQNDLNLLTLFANQAAVALENARLIEDVQRRAEQLARLNDLTRAAIASKDMTDLPQVMANQMGDLAGADGCCIMLWDADRSQAALAASKNPNGMDWGEGDAWEPSLTDRILQAGEPMILESAAEAFTESGRERSDFSHYSLLGLPLIVAEQRLGVAYIFYRKPHEFSKDEVGLCEQAAAQMALAMAKIKALEAERKRSSEMDAVRQASLSVTSSLDLQEVLVSILERTLKLVTADDVHIFTYDGKQLAFGAALWAGGKKGKPISEPRSNGLTYRVALSGEQIIVSDVNSHPLFEEWKWGGAIAGFPLTISGKVVGVMNVAFDLPHDFGEAEIRALGLLAGQAAIAIRNADLYGEMANERSRLQLLYDVTREFSRILDPDELLQRAIELSTKNLRGLAGEGYLLQPGSDRMHLCAAVGWQEHELASLDAKFDLRIGKGLVGWVAEHKQAVLLPDVLSDDRWIQVEGVDENVRSALCAPIMAGEQLLGTIMILSSESFEREQLDLLEAISRQVGLALSHAERYQQIRRRLAELTVLQQVAHVINRRLEMKLLLEEVVRQVSEVLGYHAVQVYLVEENKLALGAVWGNVPSVIEQLELTKGVMGRCVRKNEAQFVPDVSLDQDYVAGSATTRSEIAVPIRQGNVVIGVLNVESPKLDGFGGQDVRLLSLLADQVSVAVENAALYERLRKHADELGEIVSARTAELAEALDEARKADALKSQFVSDVSHELRTPLSNIRLYLELLSKGKSERYQAYLGTLSRETDRLVALIEDLLAISRLDAGTVTPSPRPLDLNDVACSLVEDRKRLLAERELEVGFNPQDDLPQVVADEHMLSQVIANLLTNAMNYTPSGGRVEVSTSVQAYRDREWVTLTVADTGLGIPPEEQEHLFERFFRGSAGRRMGNPGTGLGLAICKEILTRHGGHITVESQQGAGSTFTVLLPPAQDGKAPVPMAARGDGQDQDNPNP